MQSAVLNVAIIVLSLSMQVSNPSIEEQVIFVCIVIILEGLQLLLTSTVEEIFL